MLCPLLATGEMIHGLPIGEKSFCFQELCAWWDHNRTKCAIYSLNLLKDIDTTLYAIGAKVGG